MSQFITLKSDTITIYALVFMALLCHKIYFSLINPIKSTKQINYEKNQTSKTNLTFNRDYYSLFNNLFN